MEFFIELGNGITLKESDLKKAENAVLLAIKKELPEELFSQVVINAVLDKCKEDIKSKLIVL